MNRISKILITLILCSFSFANISAEEKLDSIHFDAEIINDSLFIGQDSVILVQDSLLFKSIDVKPNSTDLSWIINKLPSWLQGYANSLLN